MFHLRLFINKDNHQHHITGRSVSTKLLTLSAAVSFQTAPLCLDLGVTHFIETVTSYRQSPTPYNTHVCPYKVTYWNSAETLVVAWLRHLHEITVLPLPHRYLPPDARLNTKPFLLTEKITRKKLVKYLTKRSILLPKPVKNVYSWGLDPCHLLFSHGRQAKTMIMIPLIWKSCS